MSEFFTVKEVALLLRVDNSTVRRWIKQDVLTAVALPKTGVRQMFRVRRSTLETLLADPPLRPYSPSHTLLKEQQESQVASLWRQRYRGRGYPFLSGPFSIHGQQRHAY